MRLSPTGMRTLAAGLGLLLFATPAFAGGQAPRPPVAPDTPATAASLQTGAGPLPEAPPAEPTLAEAIGSGRVTLDLRYRFEVVDQDGFDSNGLASTLRTALSYTTRAYRGFSVALQAENVVDIGAGSLHDNLGFGDRDNVVAGRPVVADPAGTDMLQAYLQYEGEAFTARAGRQELTYDDHRFVGNVGFRQHHQSYRALRIGNTSIDNLQANYAYIDRVYRITGDHQAAGHHLINVQYRFAGVGNLTGYAYLLRYGDGEVFRTRSTDTVGAEFKGQRDLGYNARFLYELEFASQQDSGNNPARVDEGYLHVMLGAGYDDYAVRAGWERLGGSQRDGQFQTSLATLHAFNGWADKFLSTPTEGLDDLYVRAEGPLGPLAGVLAYHDFSSSTGSIRYGRELDLQLTYRAPWKQAFGARAAIYDAREFSSDTTKLWLYSTYSF